MKAKKVSTPKSRTPQVGPGPLIITQAELKELCRARDKDIELAGKMSPQFYARRRMAELDDALKSKLMRLGLSIALQTGLVEPGRFEIGLQKGGVGIWFEERKLRSAKR